MLKLPFLFLISRSRSTCVLSGISLSGDVEDKYWPYVRVVQNAGEAKLCAVPRYRMDVGKLHKRFTRSLPGLDDLSYQDRLEEQGVFCLELKRLRADMISVYKIMRGINVPISHDKGVYN